MDTAQVSNYLKEYDKSFIEKNRKKIKKLSHSEKQMFEHLLYDYNYVYRRDVKYNIEVPSAINKMSDYVRRKYGKIIDIMISSDLIDDYYYIIDKINKFQYSRKLTRRSFRTSDCRVTFEYAIDLIYTYYIYGVLKCGRDDMAAFLREDFSQDFREMKKDIGSITYNKQFEYIIAARIDMGDEAVIDVIKEMITSQNNTAVLNVQVIRAVFMSSNSELHDLMCKLLVAARLSEGLRQSICENADCGTAEAFIKLIHTINDENLIRFPSIKRAIGTWTGICQYENPDRIAQKVLDDMLVVLTDSKKRIEYINTSDAVHIYMGLWGIAFYEFVDTQKIMLSIVESSYNKKSEFLNDGYSANKIQLLTIGYFCLNGDFPSVSQKISFAVIENYPDDFELLSLFKTFYIFNNIDGYYYYRRPVNVNYYKDIIQKIKCDKYTAERHYQIMLDNYNNMPKKEISYEKLLFPWFQTSISKSDILCFMAQIAVFLDDDDKKDFLCGHISEIDKDSRSEIMDMLTENQKTKLQRSTIINCIADKEYFTRNRAVKSVVKMNLSEDEYIKIESFAKYKKEDVRQGILDILKKRNDKGLYESIERMLKTTDEYIHLAGLDLFRYAINERKKSEFEQLKTLVSSINNPSDREKILIEEVMNIGNSQKITAENGYGLYDVNVKFPVCNIEADVSVVQNFFSSTEREIDEMFEELFKVVDKNSNLEYTDDSGEEHLLGNLEYPFYAIWRYRKQSENVPFSELWEQFYTDVIKTPQRFWCMYLAVTPLNISSWSKKLSSKDENKCIENLKLFLGDCGDYHLKNSRINDDYQVRQSVIGILECIKNKQKISVPLEVLKNMFAYILNNFSENDLWLDIQKVPTVYYRDKKFNYFEITKINMLYQSVINYFPYDFEELFLLFSNLLIKNGVLKHYKNNDISDNRINGTFDLRYCIKAYQLNIISKDMLYKLIFEIFGIEASVSVLNIFLTGETGKREDMDIILSMENKKLDENNEIPKDSEFYKAGREIASEFIDNILNVELKRGDTETVFSKSISTISRIYGMDRLIEILKALGDGAIERITYYSYSTSKNDSLSHLLSVCYPTKDDNAEKLAKYMSESKIKNDRLIDVAMFAPQWIDIIEDYMKIDGLKSGCYYFMAHTAEHIDKKREAIIAKYTPLTIEELNNGCFDVKWFNEAYSALGDKMFNKLYKSSKYISSSNSHTRARKFADAALGKYDIYETEKLIEDKRNKDLLRSLAIIPSQDKSDILQRYEFINKFLKESKKFGSQRRASEKAAVDYALKNLAVTAGYSDETRLTLSMETELVKSNSKYFEWNAIGEYNVKIDIDLLGKVTMRFNNKDGKKLKSAPAAIKNDENFILIKEFYNKLKDQYRRTVKMFEIAMEERDGFSFGELKMLCENPITKLIVQKLVFVSCDEDVFVHGVINNQKLVNYKGETADIDDSFMLRTAHPFDFYSHKIWSEYQQMFFNMYEETYVMQPFRQVFRELYVKLDEELEKERSLMFAGNQIQTNRTIGALQNRRWVADYEDGLQKVYYKDDIIAGIYAVADWFSPSDIEAPVLEGVTFVNRRTYMPVKIKDLPDILYSEVMRDVDLAVSVAHAGGVDPETSHSTVEMRKVILEFNLKLFNVTNVTFEKNHAIIDGKHGRYSIHLGSGVIHKIGGRQINVVSVSSGKTNDLFLPFIDEDPKTAEIMTKVLTFAQDDKIKDPYIMEQILS